MLAVYLRTDWQLGLHTACITFARLQIVVPVDKDGSITVFSQDHSGSYSAYLIEKGVLLLFCLTALVSSRLCSSCTCYYSRVNSEIQPEI